MNAVSKTIIQIKLGKRGEVEDYIDQKTSEVNAIPGIKTWGIIYTGENEVTVIAVYENKKSAEQATEYANQILADFAPLVATLPVHNIFDANWH